MFHRFILSPHTSHGGDGGCIGNGKTTAEGKTAVSLCGERMMTRYSPSLLLPWRLITEAGQGES